MSNSFFSAMSLLCFISLFFFDFCCLDYQFCEFFLCSFHVSLFCASLWRSGRCVWSLLFFRLSCWLISSRSLWSWTGRLIGWLPERLCRGCRFQSTFSWQHLWIVWMLTWKRWKVTVIYIIKEFWRKSWISPVVL